MLCNLLESGLLMLSFPLGEGCLIFFLQYDNYEDTVNNIVKLYGTTMLSMLWNFGVPLWILAMFHESVGFVWQNITKNRNSFAKKNIWSELSYIACFEKNNVSHFWRKMITHTVIMCRDKKITCDKELQTIPKLYIWSDLSHYNVILLLAMKMPWDMFPYR